MNIIFDLFLRVPDRSNFCQQKLRIGLKTKRLVDKEVVYLFFNYIVSFLQETENRVQIRKSIQSGTTTIDG